MLTKEELSNFIYLIKESEDNYLCNICIFDECKRCNHPGICPYNCSICDVEECLTRVLIAKGLEFLKKGE